MVKFVVVIILQNFEICIEKIGNNQKSQKYFTENIIRQFFDQTKFLQMKFSNLIIKDKLNFTAQSRFPNAMTHSFQILKNI